MRLFHHGVDEKAHHQNVQQKEKNQKIAANFTLQHDDAPNTTRLVFKPYPNTGLYRKTPRSLVKLR